MKATQTTPDPVEPQTTPTPTRGLPRRLVGGLARIAFTLVRLILKGLAAAITHYPRHALAAALSLVMLAAIAYTQNRDSKKPPINEVKAQDPKPNTQVAHNDQSPIITPKDPAKPDNQVGAVSLTEPGPPPPTTPTRVGVGSRGATTSTLSVTRGVARCALRWDSTSPTRWRRRWRGRAPSTVSVFVHSGRHRSSDPTR